MDRNLAAAVVLGASTACFSILVAIGQQLDLAVSPGSLVLFGAMTAGLVYLVYFHVLGPFIRILIRAANAPKSQ